MAAQNSNIYVNSAIVMLIYYAMITIAILVWNDGTFTYVNDDAYIHLELARNIHYGNYGLNPGEFTAPSSSILWPIILSLFCNLEFFVLIPLILNIVSAIISIFLIIKTLDLIFPANGYWQKVFYLIAISFFANLFSLPFTGMEHNLQILMILCSVWLIFSLKSEQKKIILLSILAAALPLVRYENISISLVICLILVYKKRFISAFATFFITASLLGGYSYFLIYNSLSPLANSILVKTGLIDKSITDFIISNPFNGLSSKFGLFILPVHLLFLTFLFFKTYKSVGLDRIYSLSGCIVILLHLLAGKYGGFGRYELYVNVIIIMLLLFLNKETLRLFYFTKRRILIPPFFIMLFSLPYIGTIALTPLAAHNIYQQQYQMHKFITIFYPIPPQQTILVLPPL